MHFPVVSGSLARAGAQVNPLAPREAPRSLRRTQVREATRDCAIALVQLRLAVGWARILFHPTHRPGPVSARRRHLRPVWSRANMDLGCIWAPEVRAISGASRLETGC